ncbi:hypothetical protein ACFL08_03430 [Patescibacteria group bacterium]
MESSDDRIFYSPKEKKLFYVVECQTRSGNSKEVISSMTDACYELSRVIVGDMIDDDRVEFAPVPGSSRRFIGMKVFWIEDIDSDSVDDSVQRIDNEHWTMQGWLEN